MERTQVSKSSETFILIYNSKGKVAVNKIWEILVSTINIIQYLVFVGYYIKP